MGKQEIAGSENEQNGNQNAGASILSTTVNPPPQRRADDDHCKASHQLLAQNLKHLSRHHTGFFVLALFILIVQIITIIMMADAKNYTKVTVENAIDRLSAITETTIEEHFNQHATQTKVWVGSSMSKSAWKQADHRREIQRDIEQAFCDEFHDYEIRIKGAVDARLSKMMLDVKQQRDTETDRLEKRLTERIKDECDKRLRKAE